MSGHHRPPPRRSRPRRASALAAAVHACGRWRAVLAALAVAIGTLALTPQPPKDLTTGWDLANHALAFAALALAACLGYRRPPVRRALALLAVFAYGGLIEVVQSFVPGRTGEWRDLLADLVGIAIGAVLAALALRAARTVAAADG